VAGIAKAVLNLRSIQKWTGICLVMDGKLPCKRKHGINAVIASSSNGEHRMKYLK
jgi:hypothetical protein